MHAIIRSYEGVDQSKTDEVARKVNLEKAYAEFTNGVLEVSIPVTGTKHKSREIPVHEGGKVKAAGG